MRRVAVPTISPLPWQRVLFTAFERFPDARILTGTTGRQMGKTEGAVHTHGQDSLRCPNGINQIITPTYPLGAPLYRRLKSWAQPPNVQPLAFPNDSRRLLHWLHGPITECRTLYPRPGDVVGETTRYVMNVDEAGRVTEEAWSYLKPMLRRWDARQVRTGTPRGKTGGVGGFYDGYQRGLDEDGRSPLISGKPPRDKRYISMRVPCHPSLAPWWTAEAIEDARASMPPNLFEQEILARFVEGSGDVFTRELLERACILDPEGPEEREAYVIGWDPARRSDFSALSVQKVGHPTDEVAIWRGKDLAWETQFHHVKAISERYGFAPVAVDATGLGGPIAERLDELGVEVVRYTIAGGKIATVPTLEGGSGSIGKSRLVENLIAMMASDMLRLLSKASHPEAYGELVDFQMDLNVARTDTGIITGHTDVRYGHPEGGHDDTVIARALAAWLARYGHAGEVPVG